MPLGSGSDNVDIGISDQDVERSHQQGMARMLGQLDDEMPTSRSVSYNASDSVNLDSAAAVRRDGPRGGRSDGGYTLPDIVIKSPTLDETITQQGAPILYNAATQTMGWPVAMPTTETVISSVGQLYPASAPEENLYAPGRSVFGDAYRFAWREMSDSSKPIFSRVGYGLSALVMAIPGLVNDVGTGIYNAPNDLYGGYKGMRVGYSAGNVDAFSNGLLRSSVGLLNLAGAAGFAEGIFVRNQSAAAFVESNQYARTTYGASNGADDTLLLYSGSELEAGFVGPLRCPGAETLHVFGSQPVRGTTFSGHGAWSPVDGTVLVPEGTSLTVYAEHGASISNRLGNVIETGGDVSKVYSRTFMPGELAPNYVLHPPSELTLLGGTTVRTAMPLESLLQPNMGPVNWAACVSNYRSPSANLVFGVDGVFDSFGVQNPNFWKQVKQY